MKKINPFKDLKEKQAIPPELKVRVMSSIKKIKLFQDVFDLFTVKLGDTLKDLLLSKKNKK